MDRRRTPDECFVGLPDFDYTPHYGEVTDPTGGDPLRMAYLDEGPTNAAPVVLLHGDPTWSFLYRKMLPPLTARGHRVVVPDLVGFGRSDKPVPRDEYSYARHVEWTRELLFDYLGLRDITFFGQDWGSLIGLRLVAEHPERFARVAISNGGLPTGDERLSDAFYAWREFSQSVQEFPVGGIVAGACVTPLRADVIAGYDAPFPEEILKEGARVFPTLVPASPDDPAHDANVAAWASLEHFTKPFLLCYSDGDPVTRGADERFRRLVPGTRGLSHTTMTSAGHFVQEDKGEELAELLGEFIAFS